MIISRWESEAVIVERHGELTAWYLNVPAELVTVKHASGRTRKMFAFTLRAEEGWPEIERAIAAAPLRELDGAELDLALVEAE